MEQTTDEGEGMVYTLDHFAYLRFSLRPSIVSRVKFEEMSHVTLFPTHVKTPLRSNYARSSTSVTARLVHLDRNARSR